MGLMKAAKLCPQAVILPVDFDEYRKYSRKFKEVITEIAPVMEDRGVDEVYIDFTDVPGGQREGGRVLARLIQRSIFEATGLTCSIGIAPNKLLAKMASEFNKPNGISVVFESDLQSSIWPLPCRKVNGIGPKADEKLQRHGIRTIGELAARDRDWLITNFGKATGAWMHEVAWGRDSRPVVTESEPVSMSRETTFEARPSGRARPGPNWAPSSRTCARSSRRICNARVTSARPSASSCVTTTSRSPPATRRSTTSLQMPKPYGTSRVSASNECRWSGLCGCWACAWVRSPRPAKPIRRR